MIKEALFNVLGPAVADAAFLDLFAGSGSVGLEALSRGARFVVFIDNDINAIKSIKDNLVNCGFTSNYEVYRNDVFRALDMLNRKGSKFDYIYVDPPFTNEAIFDKAIKYLDTVDLLAEDGLIIIRTRRNREMPARLENIAAFRVNHYGESTLHYYRRFKEVPLNDGDF